MVPKPIYYACLFLIFLFNFVVSTGQKNDAEMQNAEISMHKNFIINDKFMELRIENLLLKTDKEIDSMECARKLKSQCPR